MYLPIPSQDNGSLRAGIARFSSAFGAPQACLARRPSGEDRKGCGANHPTKKALAILGDNARASSSMGKAMGVPCPLLLSDKEEKKANKKATSKVGRTLPYIEGMHMKRMP